MTEYTLLNKYFSDGHVEGPFEIMSQAVYTKKTHLLNLKECQFQINEIFEFLYVLARYNAINDLCKHQLVFTATDFYISGHKFQTLDEVERAIKQKAFL